MKNKAMKKYTMMNTLVLTEQCQGALLWMDTVLSIGCAAGSWCATANQVSIIHEP